MEDQMDFILHINKRTLLLTNQGRDITALENL